jgi:hypothetical protein
MLRNQLVWLLAFCFSFMFDKTGLHQRWLMFGETERGFFLCWAERVKSPIGLHDFFLMCFFIFGHNSNFTSILLEKMDGRIYLITVQIAI